MHETLRTLPAVQNVVPTFSCAIFRPVEPLLLTLVVTMTWMKSSRVAGGLLLPGFEVQQAVSRRGVPVVLAVSSQRVIGGSVSRPVAFEGAVCLIVAGRDLLLPLAAPEIDSLTQQQPRRVTSPDHE